ncbi:MAG: hypothetical protein WCT49_03965 [Candidatus Paceibacterota bacterium]
MLENMIVSLAFVALVVGVATAVLSYVDQSFQTVRYYYTAKTVCIIVTLVWLFVAFYSPGSYASIPFILFVVMTFGWLGVHFDQKEIELDE